MSFFCEICGVACTGQVSYQQHIEGKKHKKKQLAIAGIGNVLGVSPGNPPLNKGPELNQNQINAATAFVVGNPTNPPTGPNLNYYGPQSQFQIQPQHHPQVQPQLGSTQHHNYYGPQIQQIHSNVPFQIPQVPAKAKPQVLPSYYGPQTPKTQSIPEKEKSPVLQNYYEPQTNPTLSHYGPHVQLPNSHAEIPPPHIQQPFAKENPFSLENSNIKPIEKDEESINESEEGEIDEEKEDLACLYDEFEEPDPVSNENHIDDENMREIASLPRVPQNGEANEDEEDDFDDMFGDDGEEDGDAAAKNGDSVVLEEFSNNDEKVFSDATLDSDQRTMQVDTKKSENTLGLASASAIVGATVTKMEKNDPRETAKDIIDEDEMDMFGGDSEDDDDAVLAGNLRDDPSSASCKGNSEPACQDTIVTAGQSRPPALGTKSPRSSILKKKSHSPILSASPLEKPKEVQREASAEVSHPSTVDSGKQLFFIDRNGSDDAASQSNIDGGSSTADEANSSVGTKRPQRSSILKKSSHKQNLAGTTAATKTVGVRFESSTILNTDTEPDAVPPSNASGDNEKRKGETKIDGPMTAEQVLAAARRRASIPKVSRPDNGGASNKQRPSLLSSLTSKMHQSSNGQPYTAKKSLSLTSSGLNSNNVATQNPQSSQLDLPKRSYYPPVHPDKFWSTLRGWNFVRDLNDAIKNNLPSNRKKRDEAKSGKKRTHEEANKPKEDASSATQQSLPDAFDSVAQYKALWAPLCIEEAKAQILSEVLVAQSSPTTAWIQRTQLATGAVCKLELSRSNKDLSSSNDSGIGTRTSSSSGSLEPTVVLHLRTVTRGSNLGNPVCPNDLLLVVREATTIELALRGKAFDALDAAAENSIGMQKLPQGRLGFIGHALNYRSKSVDGLLVRVSQKLWSQFASLEEVYVIRIGSNVTALREFNALSRADSIPLTKYLLDGSVSYKQKGSLSQSECAGLNGKLPRRNSGPLVATGVHSLPAGFREYVMSKMNSSQLNAITAAASEYGGGGFTLIKGPPGTGKSTTLVSVLNALHLRQYQEYYAAIERIMTETSDSSTNEESAALNRAADMKPRILVCAPSNAAIDNVALKIMQDRFIDGEVDKNGMSKKYSPSIVRVGAGIVNPSVKSVGLKEMVDSIIAQGADINRLSEIVASGQSELWRLRKEIQKLKVRIQALVNACPYDISSDWEVRVDEATFETTERVLFVNHRTKKTTYDIPQPVRPHEQVYQIKKMPHYLHLLKNLTRYVERYNNETFNLQKYIILQNAANAKLENGGASSNEISSSLVQELETHVLNTNHIILTTLGSAGGRAVESIKFEVIVIDEAAQSSEPSTLVALQLGRSSHAILVGDPQQLPATIFSISGRRTKYDRSLFQRLEESGHPVHLLNTQYRMHPVISAFPRHIFYDGSLLDGPNVQKASFMGSPLNLAIQTKFPFFQPFNILDIDSKEERDGTSLSNTVEAQLVLHLYRTVDHETDGLLGNTRVAVITPYSQQSSLLHRLFQNAYGVSYVERVEISTVDAFQGREAGIVIYSCVRAGGRGGGIGFLSDVQRMNVALTRAKHFLFIIARRRSIMVNPYWRKLVGYARERSSLIHVPIDRRNKNASTDQKGDEIMFPNLACLAPVHISSDFGVASDSEYSA